jgi:M6 family metalloprotease-like protein
MPVQYLGDEFTFHNPDGTEIKVRGWGNQFAAVFETLDGYSIAKNPQTGFFHYATLSSDGTTLEPSGSRVGETPPEQLSMPRHLRVTATAARAQARAAQEATGARPRWQVRREERRQRQARSLLGPEGGPSEEGPQSATVGNYVGLCILVQFPDVPGTISSQEVTNFCNQVGYSNYGNNGSVRDYFYDVSDKKLTYTNAVTAYYTAKNNRSYYTNPSISYGTRARELIVEALNHLKAKGFNFAQLTADASGFVRALNVLYAGPIVNNWAEGLWPHSWSLASAFIATPTRKFSDYQITNIGSQLTLRTFCHENGHMICDFADLYDYGYESNGVGHYCLMCAGGSNTNPTQVCAYLKNFAGWTSSLKQVSPGQALTVVGGRNDFLIHRKSATEYFIMENRRKTGRDAVLPDQGLAIWHVDENGSNNNEQMTPALHYECALEQADGKFDLEKRVNNGDVNDLYGDPTARTFNISTTPNSRWWDGTASGLQISEITAPGATMTVTIESGWLNDRTVYRTHAKNGSNQTWVYLVGDSSWLLTGGASTDGNAMLFTTLSVALATNRKVDVLISGGKVTEATLK